MEASYCDTSLLRCLLRCVPPGLFRCVPPTRCVPARGRDRCARFLGRVLARRLSLALPRPCTTLVFGSVWGSGREGRVVVGMAFGTGHGLVRTSFSVFKSKIERPASSCVVGNGRVWRRAGRLVWHQVWHDECGARGESEGHDGQHREGSQTKHRMRLANESGRRRRSGDLSNPICRVLWPDVRPKGRKLLGRCTCASTLHGARVKNWGVALQRVGHKLVGSRVHSALPVLRGCSWQRRKPRGLVAEHGHLRWSPMQGEHQQQVA